MANYQIFCVCLIQIGLYFITMKDKGITQLVAFLHLQVAFLCYELGEVIMITFD